MRSPLLWLLLIVVGFFGWYTHKSWLPLLKGSAQSASEYVPENMRPGWMDNTETVYKWKDAQGKWHVSNELPEGVTDYQTERVSLDDNVLPAPRNEKETRVRPARNAGERKR